MAEMIWNAAVSVYNFIMDNVILHVDISLRLLHLFYKRTELLFSVRINANIVIICQNRFPGFQIIKNQIFKP